MFGLFNSILLMGFSRKSHSQGVKGKRKKEKYWKTPGGGENFDGIPGGGRKSTGKLQGVVKVLMKFQGGKVSENGYPQQRGTG